MIDLLVEWHRPAMTELGLTRFVAMLERLSADSPISEPSARLLAVVSVAADDTVFAVFQAISTEFLLQLCARAGALPHRLTPHVDARVMRMSAGAIRKTTSPGPGVAGMVDAEPVGHQGAQAVQDVVVATVEGA